jgi:hypothetical protein
LLDAGQVINLQRRKRRSLFLLKTSLCALAVVCVLRFVPHWNDRLAGRPQYARAMTILTAQEFTKAAQDRFPVILLGEDDHCEALKPTGITEDQVTGVVYLITYSEREHFSCITAGAVPVDASKFANLRTIRQEEGWTDGPRFLHPIKVLPVARTLHVYPPAYLQLLHWRAAPRFPISESQSAALAGRQYDSTSDPSVQPDTRANITVDFEKARALVRKPHDEVNARLALLMVFLGIVPLGSVFLLAGLYRESCQYLRLYERELTIGTFIAHDMNFVTTTARNKHFERQREMTDAQRKEDARRSLRQQMEDGMRSALADLHDENLRQRVYECLSAEPPDLDQMKYLRGEIQEALGHKTPEERLELLLESLKPYCAEEELSACREEALEILSRDGFRLARKFAVAMHDQFRLRARRMEEAEENSGFSDHIS